jgi:hypothetical protein
MGRNNDDFHNARAEPAVMNTTMSLSALGEAWTEYGVAAKRLQENDLETHDYEGKAYNQEKLTANIAKHGIKQPIEVGFDENEAPEDRFHIIDGHHRYVAARAAGLTHVPVKINSETPHPVTGKYGPGRLPEPHELGH